MKFRVVRIDNGSRNPQTGVASNHRTLDAAQRAISRANESLRRVPGYRDAWHSLAVQEAVPIRYTDGTSGREWRYVPNWRCA